MKIFELHKQLALDDEEAQCMQVISCSASNFDTVTTLVWKDHE